MGIMERIVAEAKLHGMKIVLPESLEPRTIVAAAEIVERKIAGVILLGEPDSVKKLADKLGVDISGAVVVDFLRDKRLDAYADKLAELRKSKGMTREAALAQLADPLYFGVMMVKMGDADGMVAGAINSTANTLRPALQILKTAPGSKIVSSFFLMDVPNCDYGENGAFVFADCGLVEAPNAEELSEIAIASAKSFSSFVGKEPKVAMLSYSTYGSARSERTAKVVEATRLAKEKAPDLAIDGELQLDAALDAAIGSLKAKGSKVAGKANVLIFPDLDSGNIGYKLTQRLGRAEAYGPLMQGLAMPVNDLSRGCDASDIVGVVAFTAVQAASAIKNR